jgi:hypothetical protein
MPAIWISRRRPIGRKGRNPGCGPNRPRASSRDVKTRTSNEVLLTFFNSLPDPISRMGWRSRKE